MKVVLRAAAGLLVTAALGACVAPFPPEFSAENQDQIAEVLADSYEGVVDNYLDPISASDLATPGLRKVIQLDPAMSLEVDAQAVSLRLRGEAFHRFSPPAADDVAAWADEIAAAMIAAWSRSAQLRTHSEVLLLEDHIRGVAESLPYPGYYSTDKEIRALLFPEYDSGVSFWFLAREGELIVWRLDADGHLEAAGLKAGDVITHLNSLPVGQMTRGEMRQRLMGPEGSKVVFTVRRGAQDSPLKIEVARWKDVPIGAGLERRGTVGVLRMPLMTFKAIEDIAYRVETDVGTGKHGGPMPGGWVLDLRGNLGSTEWVYRRLADVFLGKGTIAVQRSYRKRPKRVVNASWPDSSDNLPLVVLVDGLTDYGAEEVAAALQDNGRAVVIGASTAGDGVVMETLSPSLHLGDIMLPAARSYAPSGYAFEGRGVLPDICIARSEKSLTEWLAALRRGQGLTDLADRTRHIDPDDEAANAAHRAVCPRDPAPDTFDPAEEPVGDDIAERLALEILNDPALYRRLLRPSPEINQPD